MYLVCLGALLLASKMEERQVLQNIVPALHVCFHSYFRDGTMPRCSQLNLFVKNYFPLADFLNLEFVMLAYFNWNLVRPISSLSPGPSVAGTALGRGWYDGTSFAGGKFERGRDLCRREPLSPGTSFAGNLFRRGFWQQ